jgi:hypothetical protein
MSDSTERGEKEPSFYAVIPATVRYDDRLTPNAKLLYGEITALCSQKGYCWAKNKYFADLYGKSHGTISTWVSSLVNAGYVSRQIVYAEGTLEVKDRYLKLTEGATTLNPITYPEKSGDLCGETNVPATKNVKVITTPITTYNIDNIGDESPKEVIKAKPKKKVRDNHPDHYVEGTVERVSKEFKYFDFKPPTEREVYDFYKRWGGLRNKQALADDYIATHELNNWTCQKGKDKIQVWPLHLRGWIARDLKWKSEREK